MAAKHANTDTQIIAACTTEEVKNSGHVINAQITGTANGENEAQPPAEPSGDGDKRESEQNDNYNCKNDQPVVKERKRETLKS